MNEHLDPRVVGLALPDGVGPPAAGDGRRDPATSVGTLAPKAAGLSVTYWKRGIFAWFDPVYTASIILLRCEVEEIPALLLGEIPDQETRDKLLEHTDIGSGVNGRFIGTFAAAYGTVALVWIRPTSHLPVLVHELLHVVSFVLDNRGLCLCDQTDEAYCYYLEWLLRESLAQLDPPRPSC